MKLRSALGFLVLALLATKALSQQAPVNDVGNALEFLKTRTEQGLAPFEVFENSLNFIGSSVNDLIGVSGSPISEVFDLTDINLGDDSNIPLGVLEMQLNQALRGRSDELRTFTDRNDTLCSDASLPVSVSQNQDGTSILFCAQLIFNRTTALRGAELFPSFNAFSGFLQLDTSDTENVSVTSGVALAARLRLGDGNKTAFFDFSTIQIDIDVGEVAKANLFFGMVELVIEVPMEAIAFFKVKFVSGEFDASIQEDFVSFPGLVSSPIGSFPSFSFENTPVVASNVDGCTERQCVVLGNSTGDGDVVTGYIGYKIGACTNTSDLEQNSTVALVSNIPGLELAVDASFCLQDDNIFNPDAQFQFDLGFGDLDSFSPTSGLNLLRLLDNTLSRIQTNDAFSVTLPLTGNTFSQALATGSIFLNRLLDFFTTPQPLDDRGNRNLTLFGAFESDKEFSEVRLSFYYWEGNLTRNPNDPTQVQEMIRSDGDGTNALNCSFVLNQNPNDAQEFAELLIKGIEDSGCNITICELDEAEKYDFDEEDGDGCQIIIEAGTSNVTISSGFLHDGTLRDVQLIGLYKNEDSVGPVVSLFGLPINVPDFPVLLPTFRTFDSFVQRLEEAINDYVGSFTLSTSDGVVLRYNPDESCIEIDLEFNLVGDLGVGFDASGGLGDLVDVSVDNATLSLETSATFKSQFGVSFGASDDPIIILGNACGGQSFTCEINVPGGDPDLVVEYRNESSDLQELEVFVSSAQGPRNVAKALASSELQSIASVSVQGDSLLVIKFNPDIFEINVFVPKNCVDPMNNTNVIAANVIRCPLDIDTKPIFLANQYFWRIKRLRNPSSNSK